AGQETPTPDRATRRLCRRRRPADTGRVLPLRSHHGRGVYPATDRPQPLAGRCSTDGGGDVRIDPAPAAQRRRLATARRRNADLLVPRTRKGLEIAQLMAEARALNHGEPV